MKEISYRNFSLNAHRANLLNARPSVCQFELTFSCAIHCSHCYTDCYNDPLHLAKELKTVDVLKVLDKIRSLGVVWLCFTGGDPLAHPDFIDIYRMAKEKGFIVTVFTNGYFFNKKVFSFFKKSPPFSIEVTLNAVTKKCYERIARVSGIFERVMDNIRRIKKERLPLMIKAQVTKENLAELPHIKTWAQKHRVPFLASIDLHARLNGDTAPCILRVSPQDALRLRGIKIAAKRDCIPYKIIKKPRIRGLFPCAAAGGDGFSVDPYGRVFLCPLIRGSAPSILKGDVHQVFQGLLATARRMRFLSDSSCKTCAYYPRLCLWCPGKAQVENGDKEEPIKYFCKLAQLEGGLC